MLEFSPARTMSTLRMKRMQDTHLEISVDSKRSVDGVEKPKKAESEAEADRALTVVAKKLSKTLSVSATVNELIQQASDERNLAVMYAGLFLHSFQSRKSPLTD
jgi:ataxia telangiectasia mutated family protein